MDNRKALGAGTVLSFPGMDCTLEREVGRGSNAIVYKGSYPDLLNHGESHTVLIKELFPFHAKGEIYRDKDGNITFSDGASEHFSVHRQSFEQGNRVHLRILAKYPELVGENLNTFSQNGTVYTVLGFTGGRDLGGELEASNPDLRLLAQRMIGILDALESFHDSGFLHLDISPDNILLIGKGSRERVILIDYNSVFEVNCDRPSAYYSIKAGYSPPELRSGTVSRLCPASDLYSVAAVFFRALNGAPLTPFQMIRPTPPNISESRYLENMPETVLDMVRQILYRGLQNLPEKRYTSVSQMREAFEELLDRIDGVGITHWALWEAGRKTVARLIRDNPSFGFLRDGEGMFPINTARCDGTAVSYDRFIEELPKSSEHTLLIAPGGMGKTTAMLQAVSLQSEHYRPSQPAMVYISLYGASSENGTYIQDRILENLRFKSDTDSYRTARHALRHFLKKPLTARGGTCPAILLLLDGLNEAKDQSGLIKEITELSAFDGTRILLTSRNDCDEPAFKRMTLAHLSEDDICTVLNARGLLMPESAEMRELLGTPLMLSIFMQTSQANEKQLNIKSRDELLSEYFSALLDKELRTLSEDSDTRWQITAAVRFVLPAVAGALFRSRRAMGDAELLVTVEKCLKLLSSPLLRRVFPEWIGHVKAIRADTADAEEWYGLMIHRLLRGRLGLLIKNERGEYRTVHELIGEYLYEIDCETQRKIRRLRLIRNTVGGVIAALVLCAAFFAGNAVYTQYIAPEPFNEEYADTVFVYSNMAYIEAGRQYEELYTLLSCAANTPSSYERASEMYRQSVYYASLSDPLSEAGHMLEKMLETGEVIPWSDRPFAADSCLTLFALADDRESEYAVLSGVLDLTMTDEKAAARYGEEYRGLLSALIEVDADIAAALYQLVCLPHTTDRYSGNTIEARNLKAMMENIHLQNEHLTDEADPKALERELTVLRGKREEILGSIYSNGAYALYIQQHSAEKE